MDFMAIAYNMGATVYDKAGSVIRVFLHESELE